LDELINHTMIFREEGSATRLLMEGFLAKNKSLINQKIELVSNEAVKQAILAGLGCSLMPLIGIQSELASNKLEVIPVENLPLVTKWNLIWLSSKKMTGVSRAFIKYLEDNKLNVINDHFNEIVHF
jgi:DNA-binding transcriptional LysR family regulator